MNFYGKTSYLKKTDFNFIQTYPNRQVLREDGRTLLTQNNLYQYVLIKYGSNENTWEQDFNTDFNNTNTINNSEEGEIFSPSSLGYDLTVWQINEVNNNFEFILITSLHSNIISYKVDGIIN